MYSPIVNHHLIGVHIEVTKPLNEKKTNLQWQKHVYLQIQTSLITGLDLKEGPKHNSKHANFWFYKRKRQLQKLYQNQVSSR